VYFSIVGGSQNGAVEGVFLRCPPRCQPPHTPLHTASGILFRVPTLLVPHKGFTDVTELHGLSWGEVLLHEVPNQ
jgi:hypothetical protein